MNTGAVHKQSHNSWKHLKMEDFGSNLKLTQQLQWNDWWSHPAGVEKNTKQKKKQKTTILNKL